MGNLIHIEHSEEHATLEMLTACGVRIDDFALLRRYPSNLKTVAEAMTRLRGLLERATGNDEKEALKAVDQINDIDVLVDIINKSDSVEVQLKVVSKMPKDNSRLYDIARLNPIADVVRVALKKMSWSSISMLKGYAYGTWRRQLINDEWDFRLKNDPEVRRRFGDLA